MGFKVNVSNQDISGLYGRINKNKGEYFLGKVPMEDPCEEVKLTLSNHPKSYSIEADVKIVETVKSDDGVAADSARISAFLDKLLLALNGKHNVKRVRNSLLFINKEGNYDYIVRIESDNDNGMAFVDHFMVPLSHLHIRDFAGKSSGGNKKRSTRTITHQLIIAAGEDPHVSLAERNLLDPDAFASELKEFFEIVETAVDTAYINYNSGNVPDSSLSLRPTKVNNNQRNIGLMGLPGMGGGNDLKKAIEMEKPNVSFNDIGGLADAKKQVEGLAFAIRNPGLYKKWGTKLPRGIIMVGDPGTGKTELARALATNVDCSFFHVKITDLLSSMWSGSEARVQEVFDIAKENSPSIIFLDEVDAIGTSREMAGSEITRKMVSVLLENMDGIEENDGVIVVAATNHLNAVDNGLLRAKRFSRIIYVPRPDEEARAQIFHIHIRKAKTLAERELFTTLNFEQLIKKTNGLTGADIEEIVRRSLEEKLRQEGIEKKEPTLVSTQDILNELSVYERLKTSGDMIGFRVNN